LYLQHSPDNANMMAFLAKNKEA